MRLRTQLLLINLASIALLVGAVVYSYTQMLLNFTQASLLTVVAVVAGLLSTGAYWLMTKPIINSVSRLIRFAEDGKNRQLQPSPGSTGPLEVQRLTQSVSEMKQRMYENLEQLEAMEKTRRELIANVSHDLRTPIASIQSFVEALEDDVINDPETSRRYLKTIHKEAERLSALIDDLFELSKLEAGQERYNPTLCHIDQVIVEVLESCAVQFREKDLRVDVSVPDAIPVLWLMPDKVTRVLRNLLDNAILHSPQGSRIDVGVKRLMTSNYVEVVVRDEGEGVVGADKERIFERFYRVDKSRNRHSGGAGLGLAVARSLIRLHGGEIGVRGVEGRSKGSEFWFTLPVDRQ